jgi:hypothetical protein
MSQRIAIAMSLAALLVGWGTYSFAQEYLTQPEVHTEHGIRYVSGGIGQGERDMLRQMAGEYNLKLIFAVKQGNYLSAPPTMNRSSNRPPRSARRGSLNCGFIGQRLLGPISSGCGRPGHTGRLALVESSAACLSSRPGCASG